MALRMLVILAICAVTGRNAVGDICADGQFSGDRFVDSFGYFGCEPVIIAGAPVKLEVRASTTLKMYWLVVFTGFAEHWFCFPVPGFHA